MRKPVQIAVVSNCNFLYMYTLCDDGSMWAGMSGKELARLPDIPQDEPEQPATSTDVVAALRELAKAEAEYYERFYGPEDEIRTLHRVGNAAREILKRIDEKDEPL